MESTLVVLTTRKPGREVHRHWPDRVEAQIVSESLRSGAMVNEDAKRLALKPKYHPPTFPNRCPLWRGAADIEGRLLAPKADNDPRMRGYLRRSSITRVPSFLRASALPNSSNTGLVKGQNK